jgi:hypothetical protein
VERAFWPATTAFLPAFFILVARHGPCPLNSTPSEWPHRDKSFTETIVAEVGMDMSKWATEGNFASWLGLCPDNRITGGKVYHRGSRQVEKRAATALLAHVGNRVGPTAVITQAVSIQRSAVS